MSLQDVTRPHSPIALMNPIFGVQGDFARYLRITGFYERITSGSFHSRTWNVVIGTELAERIIAQIFNRAEFSGCNDNTVICMVWPQPKRGPFRS